MATGQIPDPYVNYNFLVEIDGIIPDVCIYKGS